jgi:hypothetical protein
VASLEALDAEHQPVVEMVAAGIVARALGRDVAAGNQAAADVGDRRIIITRPQEPDLAINAPAAFRGEVTISGDGLVEAAYHLVTAQRHRAYAQIIEYFRLFRFRHARTTPAGASVVEDRFVPLLLLRQGGAGARSDCSGAEHAAQDPPSRQAVVADRLLRAIAGRICAVAGLQSLVGAVLWRPNLHRSLDHPVLRLFGIRSRRNEQ